MGDYTSFTAEGDFASWPDKAWGRFMTLLEDNGAGSTAWDTAWEDARTTGSYCVSEVRCGKVDELAPELIKLVKKHRVALTVWEDPKYEYLGDRLSLMPQDDSDEVVSLAGECDAEGQFLLRSGYFALAAMDPQADDATLAAMVRQHPAYRANFPEWRTS